MGTKNNPAKFDCLKNAEPDEPYFVLLARDPVAPLLLRLWVELRRTIDNGDADAEQRAEAMDCRNAMLDWLNLHRPNKIDKVARAGAALKKLHLTEAIDVLVGECEKAGKW